MHSNPVHVFTYGTLMFEPVWQSVVSNQYEKTACVASGFQRLRVIGEKYPGLVRADKALPVEGVLYKHVGPTDLKRLDVFEGQQYDRVSIVVQLPNKLEASAEVYLWRNRFRHRLSSREWVPSQFNAHQLRQFQRGYRGFTR